LGELIAIKKERQDRLSVVEGELKRFTDNREDIIRSGLEADPGYRKKEEGFLANWQGLRRLTADPYVLFLVLLFDLGLFGIELAAVLAKIATFVPATYATIIAHDDFRRAYKTAHELAREIEAIQKGGDERKDGDDAEPIDPGPEAPKPTGSDGSAAVEERPSKNEADEAAFEPQAEAEITASGPDTAERKKRRSRAPGARWKPQLKASDAPNDEASEKPAGDGDGGEHKEDKGDREIERPSGH
jgi:hypothetical protein